MSCHLIKNYRLTRELMFTELEELEPVSVSDHFGIHLMMCRDCGQMFIYCFRKHTTADWREESWAFWIPAQSFDLEALRRSRHIFKTLGDLIASRPHIYLDPRNNVSWSNTGNAAVGLTIFSII